jgi:hypothetical protein
MISAGEVGAVFSIKDEASVVLRAIASQMNSLQATIDKTAASFKEIRLPKGVATAIDRMEKAMATAMKTAVKLEDSLIDVGGAADKGATAAAAGFGRIDAAISTTQGKLAILRKEMRDLGHVGNGGRQGVGGRGTHGAGGGGSAFHLGAHERFGPLAVRATGGSAIPMAAGFAGLFAGYEGGKQAFDVAQADNNMRLMGASEDAITKANATAAGMSKYGLSQVDALNAMRVASVPLNTGGTADSGLEAAGAVIPTIAKFDQLARSLKGEAGGDATKQVYELLKADELRNKLTPAEASKFVADYAKVYEGTGGVVNPKMFYSGLKYAKSAGMGFSDDFVNRYLPAMEAEEGGSTAGTMLMTTESALLGRRLKKPALAELDKMGVYNPDKTLHNAELAISNPFEYFQKELMPKLVNAGITSKAKQLEFFEKIFSRNPAETGALLGINPGNVERTAASIGRVNSLDAANANQNTSDPYAALAQSIAALKNFGAAFAGPAIPGIISGLTGFAAGLDVATAKLTSIFGSKDKADINKALFGGDDKTPSWFKWIETNWGNDKRLFPDTNKSGPHGVVGPPGPAFGPAFPRGRNPRSPQTGEFAYTPPSAPPNINANVNATLSGAATVKIPAVTIQVSGQSIAAAIVSDVRGMIEGMFKGMGAAGTNSDSGHDGRSSPTYPDHMHGSH